MSLLRKLFGSKKESIKNIDNNRLIRLLDKWGREETSFCFQAVCHELLEGNSFFLIPTINNTDEKQGEWKSLEEGLSLQLASVEKVEEIKTLFAFSDEEALRTWRKEEGHYNLLKTQDVFEICRRTEIDRIVINNGQRNTFTIERQKEEELQEEEETQEQGTKVRIGIPHNPLSLSIVRKIKDNAKLTPSIEQVYQYMQENIDESPENQFVLMIGIVISEITDENRNAAVSAIKQSLQGQKKPDYPLGIMILDENWIIRMRSINNQPFYSKPQNEPIA